MYTINAVSAIALLLITPTLAEITASQCQWKNGNTADNYQVCNPSAAQSACCLGGEACLANNLCYGSLGLIYRGACAGGWGNSTACPDQCNNVGQFDAGWANFVYCPAASAPSGAAEWWCGDASQVAPCDVSGTSAAPGAAQMFSLPFFGMLPTAIMPWSDRNFTGCAVDANNVLSVQNQVQNALDSAESSQTTCASSPSSTSTSPSSSTSAPRGDQQCPKGATIGLGAVVGVLAILYVALLAWTLWERKQRKSQKLEYAHIPQPQSHYIDPMMRNEVDGTSSYMRPEEDGRNPEVHELRG